MASRIKPKDTTLRPAHKGRCLVVRSPNGSNNAGLSGRCECIKEAGHKGKHCSNDGKEWR
jgi:hypothetical protein